MDFQSQGAPFNEEERPPLTSAPHPGVAPWGAPPPPRPPPWVLHGMPKPYPSLRDLRWGQQRTRGALPGASSHPQRWAGAYQGVPPASQPLAKSCPFIAPLPVPASCPPVPAPLGYARAARGGVSTMLAAGMGTSRPCTEAEISSRSGSLAVKTRTPGRATQQIYGLGSGPGLGIQYQ